MSLAPLPRIAPVVPESGPTAPARSGTVIRQGGRFLVIGSGGTALQLGLYAVLAALIGAQLASLASWLLSTVTTNAVHRSVTFDVHGVAHNRSDQVAAFVTCAVGLGVTSVVLAELGNPAGLLGLLAIVAVNTVVGAGRFFGIRWWLTGSGQRTRSALGAALRGARQSLTMHRMSGLRH